MTADYTPEGRWGRHWLCTTLRHRECPGEWRDPTPMPCACPCHESAARQPGDRRPDDAERARRAEANRSRRRRKRKAGA